MSDSILVLPVELKALVSDGTVKGAPAAANFIDLPASGDNVQAPFVSDTVLPEAFNPETMAEGVHLHWKLPSILLEGSVKSENGDQKVSFHTVPNRWLVTKIPTGAATLGTVTSWLINSDQTGSAVSGAGTSISVPSISVSNGVVQGATSLYQGFAYDTSAAQVPPTGGRDAVPLKAIGYGLPSFAGIYTNCQNVFGFNDPTEPADGETFTYQVTGWYSDVSDDPIANGELTVAELQKHFSSLPKAVTSWEHALCAGVVTNVNSSDSLPKASTLNVTMANTVSEALASMISKNVNVTGVTPSDVELLLNALQLEVLTKDPGGNVNTMLTEALQHESFTKSNSGTIWTLKSPQANPKAVPEAAGDLLNQLNFAQMAVDKTAEEIKALRFQIFADWVKYSFVVYPDATTGKHVRSPQHIDNSKMRAMNLLETEVGTNLVALQSELAIQQDAVSWLKGKITDRYSSFDLNPAQAPRYYAPNDPVLLFHGSDISNTHVTDASQVVARALSEVVSTLTFDSTITGTGSPVSVTGSTFGTITSLTNVTCPWTGDSTTWSGAIQSLLAEAILLDSGQDTLLLTKAGLNGKVQASTLASAQSAFISGGSPAPDITFGQGVAAPGQWGFRDYIAPWNPVKMQWKCKYHPLIDVKLDEQGNGTRYHHNYLSTDFKFGPYDVNLVPQEDSIYSSLDGQYITNNCVLNPSPTTQLQSRISNYLENDSGGADAGSLTAIQKAMNASGLHLKSQGLGGFNQALLQRAQEMQVTVCDPFLNDTSGAAFINTDVKNAVGNQNTMAPRPANCYNPIRGGYVSLTDIELIDSHGQSRHYSTTKGDLVVHVPTGSISPGGQPATLNIPPAITQNSRLLMRWLAAKPQNVETNSDPATSPICGWVIPNFLDDGLAFYQADGTAIGSLMVEVDKIPSWFSPPGSTTKSFGNGSGDAFDGLNTNLYLFANSFMPPQTTDSTYLSAFIASLNATLPTVVPGAYQQNEAASILMGRPLALTVASLALEVEGAPAPNLSWQAFKDATNNCYNEPVFNYKDRSTSHFTAVNFPVRLGNLNKVNDGLVGYFTAPAATGITQDTFSTYYAYDETTDNPQIKSPDATGNSNQPVQLNPNGATQLAVMLFDPKASLHASTGILPVKQIDIPAEFYADALNTMSVSFLMAPVLGTGAPEIPLPTEKAGLWQWHSVKSGGNWNPTTSVSKINPKLTLDNDKQTIQEGWLTWKPDTA